MMSPMRMLAESIVKSSPVAAFLTDLEWELAVQHVQDILLHHTWSVEVVLN